MKDLSRQKFEEGWRRALDEAEVEPSASVWSNVELDLVRIESNSMKKQVLFYKWLAAASVFLVVFIGGAFYYSSKNDSKEIATSSIKTPNQSTLKNDKISVEGSKNGVEFERGATRIKKAETSNGNNSQESFKTNERVSFTIAEKNEVAVLQTVPAGAENVENSTLKSGEFSLLSSLAEVPAVVHGKIEMPRLVLPAMPAVFMASAKKKKSSEDLWASVGFSAGSYNPDYSPGSQAFSNSSIQASNLNSSGYSDQSNVGSAYSAGFAMSKRVFSRWVLQSGINYVNQSIGYTTNYLSSSASNQSKVFVAEYADFASQSVTITSPYQINSEIEVVSLPLQTGYLLIDRKIGWLLNTGVAADFFIRNTLTDESGSVGRFSQATGEKSPYRAVNWAGLLGTELSYKMAKQYRISVVPSMRYSLNSVLKSTTGQASNPVVMDIGFRFRYIFK